MGFAINGNSMRAVDSADDCIAGEVFHEQLPTPWPPAPELADAQAAQSAAIDQAYAAAVTADISFTTAAGVTAMFQADADSQSVLSVSLQGYERAGSVPDGFFWKSANNDKVPFTLADLGALDKAMLDRGWVAFQKKTTLKAAIAAATTVAAVQAITW